MNAESMFRVAQIVGENMRMMQERHREGMEAQGTRFDATVIVAGQRKGGNVRFVSGLYGRQFYRGHR